MDISEITSALGKLELANLLAVGLMLWFFYSRLDSKIERISDDVKQQSARTDRLYEMFIDLLKDKKTPRTEP